MIDSDHLYKHSRLPAACGGCGWDNGGSLEIVDRYSTDYPPIPRFDADAFVEVYRAPGGDPDDRIIECESCGETLDRETCVERDPRTAEDARMDAAEEHAAEYGWPKIG